MESSQTFELNQELSGKFYSYYKERLDLENNEKSDEFTVPLLCEKLFKQLLLNAFWASLIREEGLFHNFSLSVFPKPSDETQKYAESYIFQRPVPFDPKTLAKLSGAFESTNNRIGVWLNEKGDAFDIWGFTEHANSFLEIKSFDAGQLIISFPWGINSRNPKKLLLTSTDSRYLTNPLNDKLTNFLLQRQELLKDCFEGDFIESVALRVYYKDYFQIAKLMREHQHGGTLLIVPPNDEWKKSMKDLGFVTPVAYGKVKKSIIQRDDLLKKGTAVSQNTNEAIFTLDIFPSDETKLNRYEEMTHNQQKEKASKLSEKYFASISRLTAIDGATVINYDFSILTFGAKIETANKEDSNDENEIQFMESFPFEDSEELTPKPISNFFRGTRHHSAIQFVFDNPDSLAFVGSQDGQVSVIYKENDIVHIISNAEYLFN